MLNEVYGRGNIVRLEEFAYKQKLFDDRFELTVGRLAFGDEFFSFSCDFINLTFCGAPPGNIVGDYIYNWPISQWAAVGKLNLTSDVYLKAARLRFQPRLSRHDAQYRAAAKLPRQLAGRAGSRRTRLEAEIRRPGGRLQDWAAGTTIRRLPTSRPA